MLFESLILIIIAVPAIALIIFPFIKILKKIFFGKKDRLREAKRRLEEARIEAETIKINKETEEIFESMYDKILEDRFDQEENKNGKARE